MGQPDPGCSISPSPAYSAALIVRPRLLDPDSPEATLTNLVDHEKLARLGIALEMG